MDMEKKVDLNEGDKMYLNFDENITIRMNNDITDTHINTSDPRPFDKKLEALFDCKEKLETMQLFMGKENIKKLSEKYAFIPFDYQVNNVDIMLNRFRGNGIFADQVGSGKTIQTLMSAHIMFESGAIQNALIITTAKTREFWKNEAMTKFPGIFEIVDTESMDFCNVLDDMKNSRSNSKKCDRCKLYIITDYKLKSFIANTFFNKVISKDSNQAIDSEEYHKLIKEYCGLADTNGSDKKFECEKKKIDKFVEGNNENSVLESVNNFLFELVGMEKIDGIDESEFLPLIVNSEILDYFYKKIGEELNKLKKDHRFLNGKTLEKQRSLMDMQGYLANLRDNGAEINEILKDIVEDYNKNTEVMNERIIDLLVIDEIHRFFEIKKDSKKHDDSNEDDSKNYDTDNYSSSVDVLSSINRKYCILVSATPIRSRLEDVFDLVYISNKSRLGGKKEECREYFFKTLCKIPNYKKEPFKLSSMVFRGSNSNEIDNTTIPVLINSFFTHSRFSKVETQMIRTAPVEDDDEKGIRAERKIMYLQTKGISDKNYMAGFDETYEQIQAPNFVYNINDSKSSIRHMLSAKDAYLIKLYNSLLSEPSSLEKARKTHQKIDWRRRQKLGYKIKLEDPTGNIFIDIYNALFIDEEASESLIPIFCGPTVVYATGKLRESLKNDITKYDKLVVQLKDLKVDKCPDELVKNFRLRDDIKEDMFKQIQTFFKQRNIAIVEDHLNEDILKISDENYNPMIIIGLGYQAGVNLQQFRTLIFSTLDKIASKKLLDPVDIEQWIGRIYRTGQTRNVRIITILKSDIKGLSDNNGFLEWYYDILSDGEGFNLYGDNSPDAALLQTIVTDVLQKELFYNLSDFRSFDNCKLLTQKKLNAFKSSSENNSKKIELIQSLSFSQLLEIFYYEEKSFNVKELIKNILKMSIFAE